MQTEALKDEEVEIWSEHITIENKYLASRRVLCSGEEGTEQWGTVGGGVNGVAQWALMDLKPPREALLLI